MLKKGSIVEPSPWFVPERLGSRSTLLHGVLSKHSLDEYPAYAKFDSSTLWYDIFLRDIDNQIQLVCPPLRNFLPLIIDDEGKILGQKTRRSTIDCGDRNTNIFIQPESSIAAVDGKIEITVGGEKVDIKLPRSMPELFAGKNVLTSLSKNNKLIWIRDWLKYHIKYHDVNALLFYDNASTDYSVEELAELFESIPKLLSYVVVPWNFPHGTDLVDQPHGAKFCQFASLTHARYRFLGSANGMLNLDVDELLHAENGEKVFDLLKQIPNGYMLFNGLWIDKIFSDESGSEIRHANFKYHSSPPQYCNYKWIVDPKKLTRQHQLAPHWIVNHDDFFPGGFLFRHFRQLSNSPQRIDTVIGPNEKFALDQISQVKWD